MRRRSLVAGLCIAIAAIASACQPTFIAPAPSTPCYVGTFALKTADFPSTISTPVGPETVALAPGGSVTLTTTDGTWNLTISEQLDATGNFTGTVSVQADASGTFTATDTTIAFTLTSVAGTVHLSGTLSGHHVEVDETLPGSYVDDIVGLHGQATYSCANDGLSLDFTSFRLRF